MDRRNCWEFKKCGREPGGAKVADLGVCPAASATAMDGANQGRGGGRACWVVAGTFCGGNVQGTFARKFASCLQCEFYRSVLTEEGGDFQGTRALLERFRPAAGQACGADSESPSSHKTGDSEELLVGLSEIFDVLVRVSANDYTGAAPESHANPVLASLGKTVNQTVGAVRQYVEQIQEARAKLEETQEIILSLSTPVVRLWEGVLALPLIGVLDSQRAQQAMEVVLNRIVEEKARVVIVDITGVPLVDSLVANHLAQTMAAIQLIGAEGILTGISANVAQTLVKLGVNVAGLHTRSCLADGLKLALHKAGIEVRKEAKQEAA